MKVAGAILIALIAVGALVGAYVLGLTIGLQKNYDSRLQAMGLNRRSAALYVRAAKLINRFAQITDLDGVLAGDVLSPESKKQVTQWVADYRSEVTKV